MSAFFSAGQTATDAKNETFEAWLVDTCTNPALSEQARKSKLIDWSKAPFARYCQPREEHLLPLLICCGLTDAPAQLVFNDKVLGKTTSAFLW